MDIASCTRLIDCAAGRIPADIVLRNCKVIHVFSGEIEENNVALLDGYIAGIGQYEGEESIDLRGRYLSPGLIDGHIHIESSMLTPPQFAAAVVPHGTTVVICDPHEIANVCGRTGIDYMLRNSFPLAVYAMAPSCVPATSMETSGSSLSAEDIEALLTHPRILGLAEMMNFPGTVAAAPEVIEKIMTARRQGLLIDGHAPGLAGKDLQAYIAAGISSDHECTTLEEAREKLRYGMAIFIREGTTARNLEALLPLLSGKGTHNCLLVTDDRHADDLMETGHLDHILRKAVRLGADPMTALQMVTLNPARHFALRQCGAIAPGYQADLVVFDDLEQFRVQQVFIKGQCVAENGTMNVPTRTNQETLDPAITSSVNIAPENIDLSIKDQGGLIRVITCLDGEIVTGQKMMEPKIRNGLLVADTERDLLKIAVLERHHGTNSIGLGFVQGLGIKNGAIASTVAHDSHNLIVVGTSDASMMLAIRKIIAMGGGLVVADNEQPLSALPLPVAGLMSSLPAEDVSSQLQDLKHALSRVGTGVSNPLMLLSFLALPVIPELKISDKGLVDVYKFSIVSLQKGKK